MHRTLSTLVAVLMLAAAPAFAGIVDSPLPLLDGEKLLHVFSVTGVTSAGGGGLETSFRCTSMDVRHIAIGVEIFNFDGNAPPLNDVNTGNGLVRPVASGDSITISTANTAAFTEAAILGGIGSVYSGSARIISTSKKILCTAILLDPTNAPPTSMVQLPVFAGTKQKGD